MLKNYFTTALRNLLKHKVFSIINIAGLALGIAVCMLLALYIKDELKYEQHITDHERIFRINTGFSTSAGSLRLAVLAHSTRSLLNCRCLIMVILLLISFSLMLRSMSVVVFTSHQIALRTNWK